jgi:hypothetical protein
MNVAMETFDLIYAYCDVHANVMDIAYYYPGFTHMHVYTLNIPEL